MTKDELIEEIKQRRSRLRPCGEGSIATVSDAVFSQCLGLVEQLDSPPAMAWQSGAPSALPVDAHVEGIGAARIHADDYGEIVFSTAPEDCVWHDSVPLGGRLWCPIPAPPALPKRGDA